MAAGARVVFLMNHNGKVARDCREMAVITLCHIVRVGRWIRDIVEVNVRPTLVQLARNRDIHCSDDFAALPATSNA